MQASAPGADDGWGLARIAAQAGNPGAARELAALNNIENMRFPGSSRLELKASLSVAGPVSISGGISAGGSADFSGLRTGTAKSSGKLSLAGFQRSGGTLCLGTENPAAFAVGGRARLQGSASFTADVGRTGALKARLEFDGDQ
jgi:hypothetical protein